MSADTPLAGHAMGADAPFVPAAPPAPSHATQARSLLAGHDRGALATLDADGHPFGSVALYVLDDLGQPVSLLSELAEHTRNVRRDPRVALTILAAEKPGAQREYVSLQGTARIVDGGAPELLTELAEAMLCSSEHFPPPSSPAGLLTRITVDKIGGHGPWTS